MNTKVGLWVLCTVAIVGCSTPYQPKGVRGGYTDFGAGADMKMVVFEGNGFTSETDVLQMWHRRASEVCGGDDQYMVVDREHEADVREGASTSSTTATFHGNSAQATTTTTPGPRVVKHRVQGTIRCVAR